MKQKLNRSVQRLCIVTLLLSFGCLFAFGAVQDEDSQEPVRERRLWNKRFQEARANKKKQEPNQTYNGQQKTQKIVLQKDKDDDSDSEMIGITFWRLQRTTQNEASDKPIITVIKSNGLTEQFNAERAITNQAFSEGELVRMGIEVARETNAYLYIINREIYADGKLSDPYLIFPSSSTPKGGNIVTAGRIVYLPADSDKLPYFTIQRSQSDKAQVGEKLTIIVSPEPLQPRGSLIKVDDRTEVIKLDPAQAIEWEQKWGSKVEQRETKGQLVKAWTLAEKKAGEGEGLGEDDPLPQMIYRVKPKPGVPAMVNVNVRIAQ